jgi:hypothetical protein
MQFIDFPSGLFLFSFVALLIAEWAGIHVHRRRVVRAAREDFGIIQGGTLTLLGLLIGFTFSMALSRYDLRKSREAVEANVIRTEYQRADLLPKPADAVRTHSLLVAYLDQRILFYTTRDAQRLEQIQLQTAHLRGDLWASVRDPVAAQPNPLSGLVVAGMNEVIDSEGFTQATWLDRIPRAAWFLLVVIAILSSALVGFGVLATKPAPVMFLVFPLMVSLSFFMIAEFDSPRSGLVNIEPHNLVSLSASVRAQPKPP